MAGRLTHVIGRRRNGEFVWAGDGDICNVPDGNERVSMGTKLYVGNLTYGITDAKLRDIFAEFGEVRSAQVVMDRDTGRSKGFGFVEMGSDNEAKAAIDAMNGKDVEGRSLTVNEARPREDRGGGGSRGGYGGGGGGGRSSGGGGYGGGGGGGGGRRY